MRTGVLTVVLFATTGCALFDFDGDESPPVPVSSFALPASCSDAWKSYTDEIRLINDDEANWRGHDDSAIQHLAQFGGSCGAADTREAAAMDVRCKALWDIYLKEVSRMTKDDRTWRDHDLQQTEAMNRIRSSCTRTACTLLPGVRCVVPDSPS